MSKSNSQGFAFNLPWSVGSNTRIVIFFLKEYEVWVLQFEDYITCIKEHGDYIWKSITEGPYPFSKTNEYVYTHSDYGKIIEKYNDITKEEKDKLQNDLRAQREIHFVLTPNLFRLVSSSKTTKEIWDCLKELYSSDSD